MKLNPAVILYWAVINKYFFAGSFPVTKAILLLEPVNLEDCGVVANSSSVISLRSVLSENLEYIIP